MKSKRLKYFIRVLLSLVALYIIITKVDLSEAWFYLSRAKLHYILLAFASFFISKVIAAFRINRFYHTQGVEIPERLNLKLNFLGMFYNLFIPLVGGEGYKAYWIKKNYHASIKKILAAALLDRASGLAALALVTATFFMFSNFSIPYKPLVLLIVPIVYAVHYLVMHLFFKSFISAWISTHLLSVGVQLLQAATTFFVVMAIGIDDLIVEYVFVFLLASFAFILPMMGAREMAFVFGAEFLGLDMELSLAISLLFYLSLAFSSLLGSYFLLVPGSLQKDLATAE